MQPVSVVLDFWATWYGPCISSFPGMQKVVEKYKSNSGVKIVFVNTWERGENKVKKASDFIRKKNYTFELMFDMVNSAAELFKVEGIPTKFVLDQSGNIRFRSVGYMGSDAGLIAEVTTMIDALVEEKQN